MRNMSRNVQDFASEQLASLRLSRENPLVETSSTNHFSHAKLP